MKNRRRVVVTGLGVVSPIGLTPSALWDSISSGRTGIAALRAFDLTDYRVKIGAEVDNLQLEKAAQEIGLRLSDRTMDLAVIAARSALTDAGHDLASASYSGMDMPVIFGSASGSQHSLYDCNTRFAEKGVRGLRPTSVPRCMANAISARISLRFGLRGANYVVASACTSSTNAMGIAFRMIRDGYADRVLCGGSDATFDPFVYGGWNNLGVMSKNPDPLTACRPFDAHRDGCVLGEAAGALVLEAGDVASARSASIHAEVLGYGESSDAAHITRPSADGQAAAIQNALDDAGIDAGDVGYINAHGTATEANDECESAAIRKAFGSAADKTPVSSLKSYLGHTLGASGAVESVATILALRHGLAPANLNLSTPDPACNINLVDSEGVAIQGSIAMKNSFGFGGGNGVLVLCGVRA
ncbi:MAG: beta-ketoacyl-[acyl-carrier-protein] synthase family protein [Verrucomicrobia bacterium]|nr:beta-ketoacyl-[acyl-carrier-protein] synthase family protein [Verrucomicrobiota bacterium]MDA1086673.1 beta-ketoacyl-[acyl-carrier-protein] synthase family protein [Verrucomicrobiota bacterium]